MARLVLALVVLWATTACLSRPSYVSSRTALVTNAHVPFGAGAPYGDGEARITGYAAGAMSRGVQERERLPIGGRGNYVPRLELGGQLGYAFSDVYSLHLGAAGTRVEWATPASRAVPKPFGTGAAFAIGVGQRLQLPLRSTRLDVSILADFELVQMPEWAEECRFRRIEFGAVGPDGEPVLNPVQQQRDAVERCAETGGGAQDRRRDHRRLRPSLGVQVGYDVVPWLHVGALGSLQMGYGPPSPVDDPRDDDWGFSYSGDASRLYTHAVWTAGLGADATYRQFLVSTWAHFPFGGPSWAELSPSFQVRVGGRFGAPRGQR